MLTHIRDLKYTLTTNGQGHPWTSGATSILQCYRIAYSMISLLRWLLGAWGIPFLPLLPPPLGGRVLGLSACFTRGIPLYSTLLNGVLPRLLLRNLLIPVRIIKTPTVFKGHRDRTTLGAHSALLLQWG